MKRFLTATEIVFSFAAGCVIAIALVAPPTPAQEKITLTTPVHVSPGAADFRIWNTTLRRAHPDRTTAEIRIIFREVGGMGFVAGGKSLECLYEGPAAETLIVALNKVNLSTTSLEKRFIQRCQADGNLAPGTITGSVE